MQDEIDHIDLYINSNIHEPTRVLIYKFAVLWNLYENSLRKNEHGTRNIKNIVSHVGLDKDEHMRDKIDNLYDRLVKYIKETGVFSTDSIIRRYHIFVEDSDRPQRKRDIDIDELNKIVCGSSLEDRIYFLLLISTKIRNNMFHGIKEIPTLNSQVEQFAICNDTLKIIINKRLDLDAYGI